MMEILKNAILKKMLIIFIIIILLSNFIMPNYVHAGIGAKLTSGFFYLLSYVGDIGISTMQYFMVGTSKIKGDNDDDPYEIKYSPGIIFSNNVLALDVNFLNPNQEEKIVETTNTTTTNTYSYYICEWKDYDDNSANISIYDFTTTDETYSTLKQIEANIKNLLDKGTLDKYVFRSVDVGYDSDAEHLQARQYYYDIIEAHCGFDALESKATTQEIEEIGHFYSDNGEYYVGKKPTVSETTSETTSRTIVSTAAKLQKYISKWYQVLQTIALVCLLSVLVYIGIRIVLSSTSAQGKSKYKNMLKDWLVAICIVFVIHYVMTLMLNMIEVLNGIIKSDVITTNADGTTADELISSIRNSIVDSDFNSTSNWKEAGDTAGYTIIYLALVILTGIFTFQYLKRVVFMAFLTMISPMIAFTYPLDKIKDNRAQAFSYWLREYIFNCLIQPVHLLLYTVFITNVIDFAKVNTIYAIVALAFLIPAEKILKEMFGLKSNSPTSNTGTTAAATSAMVMGMLGKIRGRGQVENVQKATNGGNNTGKVRNATNNGSAITNNININSKSLEPDDSSNEPINVANPASSTNSPYATSSNNGRTKTRRNGKGSYSTTQNNSSGQSSNRGNSTGQSSNRGNSSRRNSNRANSSGRTTSQNYSMRNGLRSIAGINKLGSHAFSGLKKAGKTTAGVLLGTAAATAAIAANVADGDLFDNPTKAFGEIAATGIGGYKAGESLVDRSKKSGQDAYTKIKKAQYGDDYDEIMETKEFMKTEEYKELRKKYKDKKEELKQYLNSNITNAKVIDAAMENDVRADECETLANFGMNDEKDITKYAKIKRDNKGLKASELAARMSMAKNMPEELVEEKNKDGFILYASRLGITLNEQEATKMQKEIINFM